jgi:hypothetical protein
MTKKQVRIDFRLLFSPISRVILNRGRSSDPFVTFRC